MRRHRDADARPGWMGIDVVTTGVALNAASRITPCIVASDKTIASRQPDNAEPQRRQGDPTVRWPAPPARSSRRPPRANAKAVPERETAGTAPDRSRPPW